MTNPPRRRNPLKNCESETFSIFQFLPNVSLSNSDESFQLRECAKGITRPRGSGRHWVRLIKHYSFNKGYSVLGNSSRFETEPRFGEPSSIAKISKLGENFWTCIILNRPFFIPANHGFVSMKITPCTTNRSIIHFRSSPNLSLSSISARLSSVSHSTGLHQFYCFIQYSMIKKRNYLNSSTQQC